VTTYLAVTAATWGVAMALSPLLQIRAILAERSSRGVSAGYQWVLVVGFFLWLAYGIAIDNWAIIVPNVVAATVSLTALAVMARYRPADAPQ
jgi:MtN3 and saliva related transmembrane protein